jgi:ketosteroid isomerase-like protein
MRAPAPALEAWHRAMAGLAEGDESVLREVYAEDLEWYDMFFGTLHGGPTVARTLAALAGRDFRSIDVDVRRSAVEGDTGAVEWVQVLHTDGRDLRMEGVTVLTVEDGRITRWCDYIQPLNNRKP